MNYIDKYAYSSKLKDVSPELKIAFALITLCVCVASNSAAAYGTVFFTMSYFIISLAKVPPLYYIKLLCLPVFFLLLSVFGIIVNISAEAPFISISLSGAMLGVRLAGKSFSAVSCLYFLILTTPLRDITAFLIKIGVSTVLIEQMTLIYRFIFLLMEKTLEKRDSQLCRFGYSGYKRGLRSLGMLFASVFVEAYAEAGQIHDAMRSRGYDGTLRFLKTHSSAKITDWIRLGLFELVLVAVSLWF